MNFDIVVGNPPYLKGKWKKFIEFMNTIGNIILVISPDGSTGFSSQVNSFKKECEKNNIQDIIDCTSYFPNINSGKIVYYYFNKNNKANIKILNKKTPTTNIINRITNSQEKLYAELSKNRSKKFNNLERYDNEVLGSVRILESIRNTGPVFKWIKYSGEKLSGEEYWFTNRYFGNKNSPIYELSGEFLIGTNILAIKKVKNMTLDVFKKTYLHNLIRFILIQIRNGGFDTSATHIKQLPIIYTSKDLYEYFNLTQEEIDLVEGTIK